MSESTDYAGNVLQEEKLEDDRIELISRKETQVTIILSSVVEN